MIIEDVLIEDRIKRKILSKHGVKASRIKDVFSGRPLIRKSKDDRYMAIGKSGNTFHTVIFDYRDKTAFVVTAYKSSEWQKNLYKNQRG
ncbi:MAG: hypothetical protein ABEJ56_01085 [Candidatus Nanohaloarchaea archaeon]